MPIVRIFRHALPFILCNVVILVLVTFVPAISFWLPELIMRWGAMMHSIDKNLFDHYFSNMDFYIQI